LNEATITYPKYGTKGRVPFPAFGEFDGVAHLFGILQNEKTDQIFIGRTVLEGSFWTIIFADLPTRLATYTFRLLGFPGGLLGTVRNVKIRGAFGGMISYPVAPGDNPVCSHFSATGSATTNDAPSGYVIRQPDGTRWDGVPLSPGPVWCLSFNVDPDPNSTYNLHVDVGATGMDSNGLQIPQHC
jgi:hypothetical protein